MRCKRSPACQACEGSGFAGRALHLHVASNVWSTRGDSDRGLTLFMLILFPDLKSPLSFLAVDGSRISLNRSHKSPMRPAFCRSNDVHSRACEPGGIKARKARIHTRNVRRPASPYKTTATPQPHKTQRTFTGSRVLIVGYVHGWRSLSTWLVLHSTAFRASSMSPRRECVTPWHIDPGQTRSWHA